jgi:hypothetical protein
MFDNLRQQSSESLPYEEASAYASSGGSPGRFLGLTPAQQFILSLMIFLNVTVLGFFVLLAFEKIALPF